MDEPITPTEQPRSSFPSPVIERDPPPVVLVLAVVCAVMACLAAAVHTQQNISTMYGCTAVSGTTCTGPLLPVQVDSSGNISAKISGSASSLGFANGTAAAPSVFATAQPSTGVFFSTNFIRFSMAGTDFFAMGSDGAMHLRSTASYCWTSSATDPTAGTDACISRSGPGTFNLTSAGSVGPQINAGTAAPTIQVCGTGTVTAHSSNTAGEVTSTGATTCSVNFGAPNWTNTPFCNIGDETTLATLRLSSVTVSAFTVTGLTAGDKFTWQCIGGV